MDVILDILSIDRLMLYFRENYISVIIGLLMIMFYSLIRNTILNVLNKIYDRVFRSNPEIKSFIKSLTSIVVQLIIIFIILEFIGIDITRIGAILTALSLVLGFAFKEVLANFFGGFIILTFKPFKIGDLIQYNGEYAIVEKIELFYTTFTTFQNEFVIMPNGMLIHNEIKNINKNNTRRLDTVVGVGYSSNIKEVKDLIESILVKKEGELFDLSQPYFIGLGEIGASSLNFDIKVHVKKEMYLAGLHYLNETIKTEFDIAGIELPYNIIDLQINKDYNELSVKG